MNNFNKNDVNILDLPDKVLLIIFEKLETIDVLSSLANINSRFFRLAIDPLRIHDLNMSIKSLHGQISSIDTQALSRICQNILPHIHHQVHKLTVEKHSMKEILGAGTYSELYSLSLSNFEESILHEYLTNNVIVRDLLEKQIVHLNIFNIKITVDDVGRTCPQDQLEEFCESEILEDKTIKPIVEKYKVHPASILLRYILDRNIVCVVKSSNYRRITENIQLLKENKFQLIKEDFDQIQTRFRYYKMGDSKNAQEHPLKDWKDFIPQ